MTGIGGKSSGSAPSSPILSSRQPADPYEFSPRTLHGGPPQGQLSVESPVQYVVPPEHRYLGTNVGPNSSQAELLRKSEKQDNLRTSLLKRSLSREDVINPRPISRHTRIHSHGNLEGKNTSAELGPLELENMMKGLQQREPTKVMDEEDPLIISTPLRRTMGSLPSNRSFTSLSALTRRSQSSLQSTYRGPNNFEASPKGSMAVLSLNNSPGKQANSPTFSMSPQGDSSLPRRQKSVSLVRVSSGALKFANGAPSARKQGAHSRMKSMDVGGMFAAQIDSQHSDSSKWPHELPVRASSPTYHSPSPKSGRRSPLSYSVDQRSFRSGRNTNRSEWKSRRGSQSSLVSSMQTHRTSKSNYSHRSGEISERPKNPLDQMLMAKKIVSAPAADGTDQHPKLDERIVIEKLFWDEEKQEVVPADSPDTLKKRSKWAKAAELGGDVLARMLLGEDLYIDDDDEESRKLQTLSVYSHEENLKQREKPTEWTDEQKEEHVRQLVRDALFNNMGDVPEEDELADQEIAITSVFDALKDVDVWPFGVEPEGSRPTSKKKRRRGSKIQTNDVMKYGHVQSRYKEGAGTKGGGHVFKRRTSVSKAASSQARRLSMSTGERRALHYKQKSRVASRRASLQPSQQSLVRKDSSESNHSVSSAPESHVRQLSSDDEKSNRSNDSPHMPFDPSTYEPNMLPGHPLSAVVEERGFTPATPLVKRSSQVSVLSEAGSTRSGISTRRRVRSNDSLEDSPLADFQSVILKRRLDSFSRPYEQFEDSPPPQRNWLREEKEKNRMLEREKAYKREQEREAAAEERRRRQEEESEEEERQKKRLEDRLLELRRREQLRVEAEERRKRVLEMARQKEEDEKFEKEFFEESDGAKSEGEGGSVKGDAPEDENEGAEPEQPSHERSKEEADGDSGEADSPQQECTSSSTEPHHESEQTHQPEKEVIDEMGEANDGEQSELPSLQGIAADESEVQAEVHSVHGEAAVDTAEALITDEDGDGEADRSEDNEGVDELVPDVKNESSFLKVGKQLSEKYLPEGRVKNTPLSTAPVSPVVNNDKSVGLYGSGENPIQRDVVQKLSDRRVDRAVSLNRKDSLWEDYLPPAPVYGPHIDESWIEEEEIRKEREELAELEAWKAEQDLKEKQKKEIQEIAKEKEERKDDLLQAAWEHLARQREDSRQEDVQERKEELMARRRKIAEVLAAVEFFSRLGNKTINIIPNAEDGIDSLVLFNDARDQKEREEDRKHQWVKIRKTGAVLPARAPCDEYPFLPRSKQIATSTGLWMSPNEEIFLRDPEFSEEHNFEQLLDVLRASHNSQPLLDEKVREELKKEEEERERFHKKYPPSKNGYDPHAIFKFYQQQILEERRRKKAKPLQRPGTVPEGDSEDATSSRGDTPMANMSRSNLDSAGYAPTSQRVTEGINEDDQGADGDNESSGPTDYPAYNDGQAFLTADAILTNIIQMLREVSSVECDVSETKDLILAMMRDAGIDDEEMTGPFSRKSSSGSLEDGRMTAPSIYDILQKAAVFEEENEKVRKAMQDREKTLLKNKKALLMEVLRKLSRSDAKTNRDNRYIGRNFPRGIEQDQVDKYLKTANVLEAFQASHKPMHEGKKKGGNEMNESAETHEIVKAKEDVMTHDIYMRPVTPDVQGYRVISKKRETERVKNYNEEGLPKYSQELKYSPRQTKYKQFIEKSKNEKELTVPLCTIETPAHPTVFMTEVVKDGVAERPEWMKKNPLAPAPSFATVKRGPALARSITSYQPIELEESDPDVVKRGVTPWNRDQLRPDPHRTFKGQILRSSLMGYNTHGGLHVGSYPGLTRGDDGAGLPPTGKFMHHLRNMPRAVSPFTEHMVSKGKMAPHARKRLGGKQNAALNMTLAEYSSFVKSAMAMYSKRVADYENQLESFESQSSSMKFLKWLHGENLDSISVIHQAAANLNTFNSEEVSGTIAEKKELTTERPKSPYSLLTSPKAAERQESDIADLLTQIESSDALKFTQQLGGMVRTMKSAPLKRRLRYHTEMTGLRTQAPKVSKPTMMARLSGSLVPESEDETTRIRETALRRLMDEKQSMKPLWGGVHPDLGSSLQATGLAPLDRSLMRSRTPLSLDRNPAKQKRESHTSESEVTSRVSENTSEGGSERPKSGASMSIGGDGRQELRIVVPSAEQESGDPEVEESSHCVGEATEDKSEGQDENRCPVGNIEEPHDAEVDVRFDVNESTDNPDGVESPDKSTQIGDAEEHQDDQSEPLQDGHDITKESIAALENSTANVAPSPTSEQKVARDLHAARIGVQEARANAREDEVKTDLSYWQNKMDAKVAKQRRSPGYKSPQDRMEVPEFYSPVKDARDSKPSFTPVGDYDPYEIPEDHDVKNVAFADLLTVEAIDISQFGNQDVDITESDLRPTPTDMVAYFKQNRKPVPTFMAPYEKNVFLGSKKLPLDKKTGMTKRQVHVKYPRRRGKLKEITARSDATPALEVGFAPDERSRKATEVVKPASSHSQKRGSTPASIASRSSTPSTKDQNIRDSGMTSDHSEVSPRIRSKELVEYDRSIGRVSTSREGRRSSPVLESADMTVTTIQGNEKDTTTFQYKKKPDWGDHPPPVEKSAQHVLKEIETTQILKTATVILDGLKRNKDILTNEKKVRSMEAFFPVKNHQGRLLHAKMTYLNNTLPRPKKF